MFLNQLPEPYRTQALEVIRAKVHDVDARRSQPLPPDYWLRQSCIPNQK